MYTASAGRAAVVVPGHAQRFVQPVDHVLVERVTKFLVKQVRGVEVELVRVVHAILEARDAVGGEQAQHLQAVARRNRANEVVVFGEVDMAVAIGDEFQPHPAHAGVRQQPSHGVLRDVVGLVWKVGVAVEFVERVAHHHAHKFGVGGAGHCCFWHRACFGAGRGGGQQCAKRQRQHHGGIDANHSLFPLRAGRACFWL